MSLKLEVKILIVLFALFIVIHMNNDYTLVLENSSTNYSEYVAINPSTDYILDQIHSNNSSLAHEIDNITGLEDLIYQRELERKNNAFDDLYVEVVLINKTR